LHYWKNWEREGVRDPSPERGESRGSQKRPTIVFLTAHAPSDASRPPPWCSLHGSNDVPVFPLNAQSETTGEIWCELEAAAKQ
jgi:hypothetical protein